MKVRKSSPRVTQADLDRAIACFQRLGGTIAEVDVTPGRIRLVSTDSQTLTIGGKDAELDGELNRFLEQHGHGQA